MDRRGFLRTVVGTAVAGMLPEAATVATAVASKPAYPFLEFYAVESFGCVIGSFRVKKVAIDDLQPDRLIVEIDATFRPIDLPTEIKVVI
jgi:hypothetical protein